MLFEDNINDYSSSELVVDYFESPAASYNKRIFVKLDDIYENVLTLRQRIIDILLGFYNSGTDAEKQYSLVLLKSINYSGLVALCANSGVSSSDEWIRNYAYGVLQLNSYTSLSTLIKANLILETSGSIRYRHVGNLIKTYGEPSDIKFVLDYIPTEPNNDISDLMGFSLEDFIPKNPSLSTPEMMDSLDSYVDQLFQFGWITEYPTYHQYKLKTEKLRALYEGSSFEEVCANLNWIIAQAKTQHGGIFLTEEGYKFLYYYSGYIKEKLIDESIDCQ